MKVMKLFVLGLTSLLLVLTGCEKLEENREFAATYKGVFVRTNRAPGFCPISANVTLNFTKSSFDGSSDVGNYPSICSGTFAISQSKLIVTNSCYFTADFDWTLLFKGECDYEQNGNHLRIWRTYTNGLTDVYELSKVD